MLRFQKSTYEGGTSFPNAARCFHRNEPKIFLRVLEDVWKDYNYGQGIYSPQKYFKAWKSSKNHEKQHFLLHFWYLQTPFGVSIKLEKVPYFRVFLPKNVFTHVNTLKCFQRIL